MKTRIASSLALAAAIALGASGCAMMAPQGTTDPYAPSDGINLTVESVDVRNLLLIAAEDGENFNVVFTSVNQGTSEQKLHFTFVDPSGANTAEAEFTVAPGTQEFGDPAKGEQMVLVSIPGLKVGAMVTAFVQVGTGQDVERQVPVLDGTLNEYKRFVVAGPAVAGDSAS